MDINKSYKNGTISPIFINKIKNKNIIEKLKEIIIFL